MYMSTLAVLALAALALGQSAVPDTYSACTNDRGYNATDGLIAGTALYTELVPAAGRYMTKGDCIYRHHGHMIVSFCNGSARNRTVTQGDVRRSFDQLIKDCGDDGQFTGYHVVNNHTLAAYGDQGGIHAAGGYPPPDVPGGARLAKSRLFRRIVEERQSGNPAPCPAPLFDSDDLCTCMAWDATTRADCKKKLDTDSDGNCPVSYRGGDSPCTSYCEKTRAVFYGTELLLDNSGTSWGISPKGQELDIQTSVSTAVSVGFDIAVEGVAEDVFGVGVGFSYSVEKSTSWTENYPGESNPPHATQWVFIPLLVESCGVISENTANEPGATQPGNTGAHSYCEGDLTTYGKGNNADDPYSCTIAPVRSSNGTAMGFYVQRYLTDDFKTVLPLSEQNPDGAYVNMCNQENSDANPQYQCQAPTS